MREKARIKQRKTKCIDKNMKYYFHEKYIGNNLKKLLTVGKHDLKKQQTKIRKSLPTRQENEKDSARK
jgi:hypothetical protein